MSNLTDKQRAWIDGLREIASFMEANPEFCCEHGTTFVVNLNDYERPGQSKAKLARYARTVGNAEKQVENGTFDLVHYIGPHKMVAFVAREDVCERVVVGTEEVEVTEPDPDLVAQLPTVTRTETVEKVVWHCPDSILAAS